MRRSEREITDRAEILEVLNRCDVCYLAFGGDAYVVPLNFGVMERDGKTVLCFHSAAEGEKISRARECPRVAFAASCSHSLEWQSNGGCTMRYESVCGRGRIRFAADEEKLPALKCLMSHYRPKEEQEAHSDAYGGLNRVTVLLLEVDEITGKRNLK